MYIDEIKKKRVLYASHHEFSITACNDSAYNGKQHTFLFGLNVCINAFCSFQCDALHIIHIIDKYM